MIKKILTIWSSFVLLAIIGILFQSCCKPDDVKICGITVYLDYESNNAQYNNNGQDGIDTSYNAFAFELVGTNKEVNEVCKTSWPFIQSAYAFQPCIDNIRDSIPRANVNLSLNRDIIYNGTNIPAGSNLMSDPVIGNAINYNYELYTSYYGRINMDSTNYQLLQLDTGIYQVNLQTTTAQGNTDVQSLNVVLKQ